MDGRRFCSAVELNVVATGGPLAASVSPNPFNPQGVLRFSIPRDGAVRVRLFDIHGRVVRTVLQHSLMPAGEHEAPIDGRAQNGQTLASGVYFYEVEAAGETVKGRFTVLK